jgi:hypothetical protein
MTRLNGGIQRRCGEIGATIAAVTAQLVPERVFERREREGESNLL